MNNLTIYLFIFEKNKLLLFFIFEIKRFYNILIIKLGVSFMFLIDSRIVNMQNSDIFLHLRYCIIQIYYLLKQNVLKLINLCEFIDLLNTLCSFELTK